MVRFLRPTETNPVRNVGAMKLRETNPTFFLRNQAKGTAVINFLGRVG